MYEGSIRLKKQTGKTFLKQWIKSNPVALKVLKTYVNHLSQGLVTISYVLNPEKIILGGGILRDQMFCCHC